MNKRLALVAVWILGTGAAISLAWSAVSIVGGQVTDSTSGELSADQVSRAVTISTLGQPPPVLTSGTSTRVTMPAPVTAPVSVPAGTSLTVPPSAQTLTPVSSPVGTAATVAATAPPVSSSGGGGTSTPAPPPDTAAPTATPALQYFHGVGGSAGLRCHSQSAVLEFATPKAGWTMRVHDAGPEKVDVEFESGDRRTRIIVRCDGGGKATEEIKER